MCELTDLTLTQRKEKAEEEQVSEARSAKPKTRRLSSGEKAETPGERAETTSTPLDYRLAARAALADRQEVVRLCGLLRLSFFDAYLKCVAARPTTQEGEDQIFRDALGASVSEMVGLRDFVRDHWRCQSQMPPTDAPVPEGMEAIIERIMARFRMPCPVVRSEPDASLNTQLEAAV